MHSKTSGTFRLSPSEWLQAPESWFQKSSFMEEQRSICNVCLWKLLWRLMDLLTKRLSIFLGQVLLWSVFMWLCGSGLYSMLEVPELLSYLSYDEITESKNCILFSSVPFFRSSVQAIGIWEAVAERCDMRRSNLFHDESGLLKNKGWFKQSEIFFQEKHPLILPKCHVFKLLVQHYHQLFSHPAGVTSLIAAVLRSYWVIALRTTAKGVKRECMSCWKIDARPCHVQVAPQPAVRILEAPPVLSNKDWLCWASLPFQLTW